MRPLSGLVGFALLAAICGAALECRADGIVFPGGITVGTIAGIVAATHTTQAGPPPPPAPYYARYEGYAGRGRGGTRCWIEPEQAWNGYGFVVTRARTCR